MTQTISSRLFTPFTIGNNLKLQHRVVLAPLTRTRTTPSYAQLPFTEKYYAQRASTPGTLLIAEGTIIHPKALGLPNSPGIWSQEQIDSWKKVCLTNISPLFYLLSMLQGYGGCPRKRLLYISAIVRRRSCGPTGSSERA